MMGLSPREALRQVRDYLSTLKVTPTSIDPNNADARRLFRRFHSVLIWNFVLDRETQPEQLRLYQRECTADLASAYFLTSIGIYKAARLLLRSSLENCLRVKILASGADIARLLTVPELVDAAKVAAVTIKQKHRIDKIYALYSDLCATVHSVAVDYMSLRVPFERIADYEESECVNNFSLLDRAVHLLTELYYVTFVDLLDSTDYRNADLIRDAVKAEVKREALGS